MLPLIPLPQKTSSFGGPAVTTGGLVVTNRGPVVTTGAWVVTTEV